MNTCPCPTSSEKSVFKVIVVGDSGVGKTCLTYRLCGSKFPRQTQTTIAFDFREKIVNLDGESIKVFFLKMICNYMLKLQTVFMFSASIVGYRYFV